MIKTKNSAFTLTEILVVIVIIVLVLAMALPVFKFITGSRSQEGGINQITAMLARVRTDAIGRQKIVGVAFFPDSTGRTQMAEVEFLRYSEWDKFHPYQKGDYITYTDPNTKIVYYFVCTVGNTNQQPPAAQTGTTYWQWFGGPPIDFVADTDVESLPLGVSVQTMCDYQTNAAAQRLSDNYLGVGIIIFAADGSLAVRPYAIPRSEKLGTFAGFATDLPSAKDVRIPTQTLPTFGVMSQIGLVVFDRESFTNLNFTPADPTYNNSSSSWQAAYTATAPGTTAENVEEQWLDNHAQPLLINRFTGMLIRPD